MDRRQEMSSDEPMVSKFGEDINTENSGGVFEIRQANEVFAPRRDILYNAPFMPQTITNMIAELPIYLKDTKLDTENADFSKLSREDFEQCYHVYEGEKYRCCDVLASLDCLYKIIIAATDGSFDGSIADIFKSAGYTDLDVKTWNFILCMLGRCFLLSYFTGAVQSTSKPEIVAPRVWERFLKDIKSLYSKVF